MNRLSMKPLVWISVAGVVLTGSINVLCRWVQVLLWNNLPAAAAAFANLSGCINVFVTILSATLLCITIAIAVSRWAMSKEQRVRDDEWRRQIVLVEIDEPSSVDPPSTDSHQVRLAAQRRWTHVCLPTAIILLALGTALWQASLALYLDLPLWLVVIAIPLLGRLMFLIGCELVILLIISRVRRRHVSDMSSAW